MKIHAQDDGVILFSLYPSHYCCANMHHLRQDDKLLNVTESAARTAGADVTTALIY